MNLPSSTLLKPVFGGLISFVLCTIALVVHAEVENTEGWQLELQKDGVSVLTRAVEGSDYREIRALARIRTDIPTLITLMRNAKWRQKWEEHYGNYRIEEIPEPATELIYLHYDMPWPISDRDMFMRVSWSRDPTTGAIVADSSAEPGAGPKYDQRIRISHARSIWRLIQEDADHIQLDMRTHLNPNGPIPAWLINQLSVQSPYNAVTKIRNLAESRVVNAEDYSFLHKIVTDNRS